MKDMIFVFYNNKLKEKHTKYVSKDNDITYDEIINTVQHESPDSEVSLENIIEVPKK